MGILAWIVVGLIAGWLAGQVMKGGGYGVLVDIGRHHSRHLGRLSWRMDIRHAGNLACRRLDWINYCCLCRSCHSGRAHPLGQESLNILTAVGVSQSHHNTWVVDSGALVGSLVWRQVFYPRAPLRAATVFEAVA